MGRLKLQSWNLGSLPVASRMHNFTSGGCARLQQANIFANASVTLLVSVALLMCQFSLERIPQISNRVAADLRG